MRFKPLAGLGTLLTLTALAALLTGSAGGQPPTSLEPVFGKGADGVWSVTGAFTAALTVGKDPVTLENKAPAAGPRQVRALLRLRTDVAPAASADLYLARNDKDTGLRMLVSATRGAEAVSCLVQQNGKPLHDEAALAAKLDWPTEVQNGFTYYPRAYSLNDIRPGWPEDFRVRIEHDMAALPGVHDKWLSVRVDRLPPRPDRRLRHRHARLRAPAGDAAPPDQRPPPL
jgi:hypothetical protein